MDKNSLAHSSWNCKYHIVFAPKYRRKVVYGNLKLEIGQILRDLCQRKGIIIHEAEACPDHIHMLVSIPPEVQRIRDHGVSERQEFPHHLRAACEPKVPLRFKALLVSRVLRRYRRQECEENRGIHQAPAPRGHGGGPDQHQGIHRPVHGGASREIHQEIAASAAGGKVVRLAAASRTHRCSR